jgi:hypothetical protein
LKSTIYDHIYFGTTIAVAALRTRREALSQNCDLKKVKIVSTIFKVIKVTTIKVAST